NKASGRSKLPHCIDQSFSGSQRPFDVAARIGSRLRNGTAAYPVKNGGWRPLPLTGALKGGKFERPRFDRREAPPDREPILHRGTRKSYYVVTAVSQPPRDISPKKAGGSGDPGALGVTRPSHRLKLPNRESNSVSRIGVGHARKARIGHDQLVPDSNKFRMQRVTYVIKDHRASNVQARKRAAKIACGPPGTVISIDRDQVESGIGIFTEIGR